MPASSLPIRAVLVTAFLLSVTACELKSGDHNLGGIGGIAGNGSGQGGMGFGGSSAGFFDGGGTAGAGGGFFDSGVDSGVDPFCPRCPPPPPSPVSGFLAACCTSTGCGFSTGGLLSNSCIEPKAGALDLACPDATAPIFGAFLGTPDLAGCCTSNGQCGVSLDSLGLGCVERGDIGVGAVINLGSDPRLDIPCGQPDTDAGAGDAGDPICAWALSVGVCDPIASCERVGSSPFCTCPDGYADLSPSGQRATLCGDVNECLLGSGACDAGQCVNLPGTFACESIDP